MVYAASASRQDVTSSNERIVFVGCNANRFITMDYEVTLPDFFVLVGP